MFKEHVTVSELIYLSLKLKIYIFYNILCNKTVAATPTSLAVKVHSHKYFLQFEEILLAILLTVYNLELKKFSIFFHVLGKKKSII